MPVLVQSPTYPGLLAIARAAGLRPVPVPVDADGLRTDLLASAFTATGARLVCHQTGEWTCRGRAWPSQPDGRRSGAPSRD
jgi:hypothetical protein